MNKRVLIQSIIVLTVLFIIIQLMLKSRDIEYYENYNRAIQEPDTLKSIELN